MKTAGKVFVVTGGGSGIGRALTLALLKQWAKVAAVSVADADSSTFPTTSPNQAAQEIISAIERKKFQVFTAEIPS